ncbi:hypothetical protein [Salicibibacter halophilus]|nr:hypothetical protein [Salicibibacter halophilus]
MALRQLGVGEGDVVASANPILYQGARMDALMEVCWAYGVPVIEVVRR